MAEHDITPDLRIKPEDIFGRLTAKRPAPKKNGKSMWECLCDPARGGCGRIHGTQEATLLSGKVTSCGCGYAGPRKTLADLVEAPLPPTAANIKDEVFGRLRAVSYAGRPEGFRRSAWNCHCAPDLGGCDNYVVVTSNSLRTGNTTSCGCFRGDRLTGRADKPHPGRAPAADPQKGAEFIDLTNWPEPFGLLRVIDRAPNIKAGKTTFTMWNCHCDPEIGGCGGRTVQSGVRLRKGAVGSCGCLRGKNIAIRSEAVRKKAAEYMRSRREDPRFVIEKRMRARVRASMKRNGGKRSKRLFQALGYTVEELETRLLETMPEGSTWDDFTNGLLEIHHIRELWRFSYTSEDDPQFKKAWALSNLTLLTVEDHLKISAAGLKERAGLRRGSQPNQTKN